MSTNPDAVPDGAVTEADEIVTESDETVPEEELIILPISKVVFGDETLIDLTGDTVTADTLAEGYTAHGADGAEIVGTMTSGGGDVDVSVFDLVIRTQAEFEAMLASDTWLDAKSVCFVGDGGTLKFSTTDGGGVEIPSTVKNIQGLNNAMISVSNFVSTDTNAALFYATTPSVDAGYWIRDIAVECTGLNYAFGFYQCVNLTGCNASVEGFENTGSALYYDGWGVGFYYCENLVSCNGSAKANGVGSHYVYAFGGGFENCTNLVNCSGFGEGTCDGDGNIVEGYGFGYCTQLVNCVGTGISDDSVISDNIGYGFRTCNYLSNCKAGTTASTTGLLGGFNTYVDDVTVG